MKATASHLKLIVFIFTVITSYYIVEYYGIFGPDNIALLQQNIQSLGWLAPIGFIAIYTIGTMLFLPGTVFTLLGGAIFGVAWGSLLSIIGATTGAVAAHWTAQLLSKETVDSFLHKRFAQISTYNRHIEQNGFLSVLVLRLTPFIPYNGLNLVLAYTSVRLKDYAYATALGVAPSVIAYVYLGEAIASLSIAKIVIAILLIIFYIFITAMIVRRIPKLPQSHKINH